MATVSPLPYVVNGQDHHIEAVLGRLRKADFDEVFAATGEDPDLALVNAWKNSLYRWSIVWRGEVIGVFGLTALSLMGETGVPWLLGTDAMAQIKRQFAIQSRTFIHKMLAVYPVLMNFVDARNTLSIKWLKWVGFELQPPKPYGVAGMPFHRFEMRRK